MVFTFFKKIAYFFFPLIFVFLLAETAIYFFGSKKIGLPGELTKIINKKEKINTLFLGDSHMLAIDTSLFDEKVASFWYGGLDLYYMDQLIEKKFISFPNLKTVVIDLSYFIFSNSNVIHNPNTINTFFVMGILPNDNSYDYRYLSTIYSKSDKLVQKFGKKKTENNTVENRFDIVRQLKTEDEIVSHAKYKNITQGKIVEYGIKHPDIVFKNIQYLKAIDSSLKKKNIRVIYIQTPHHPAYLENYRYFKQYNDIIKELKITNKIEFYDFSKIFENERSLFRDSDHLNEKGAVVFSTLIKKYIEPNSIQN